MVALEDLQGQWMHSHPQIGSVKVTGHDVYGHRGRLGRIVQEKGLLAMTGFYLSKRKSTPSRVVWQSGRIQCSWTRITQVPETPQAAPEAPKKRRPTVAKKTGTPAAKRHKVDEPTLRKDRDMEAERVVVEKSTEDKDAKANSEIKKKTNAPQTKELKHSVQPGQYASFYVMIAGYGQLFPIPDINEKLQHEMDRLSEDAVERVNGFLGHDPRDNVADLEFSSFEPLKQHALKQVIASEREGKPLFRWAAGRGPRDAPADVRCELEEEHDNMLKVHFLHKMEQNRLKRENRNTEDEPMPIVDSPVVDIDSILDGQFSD